MKLGTIFNINWQDFIKGLIVSVLGAVFAVIQSSIAAGNFTLDWTNIWHISLGAFIAYLAKNFFSPTPTTVQIDPSKTTVVDAKTKEKLL